MNEYTKYYEILGVLPKAEDVVIRAVDKARAAYKTMAQRYHFDWYSGSAGEATTIMEYINNANNVLSNPIKRKKYDDQRKANRNNTFEEYKEEDSDEYTGTGPLDNEWLLALEYYPDLVRIDNRLSNISPKLAYTFRAYLLYEKKFQRRVEIANIMENKFLETYFGSNLEILEFAKDIILDGNRGAARELNKAIRLLGNDVDAGLVIRKIREVYYPEILGKLKTHHGTGTLFVIYVQILCVSMFGAFIIFGLFMMLVALLWG